MFDNIIGNEIAKNHLEAIITKKTIANTFLFSGPEGVGKSLFARTLAIYLMYPNNDMETQKKRILENNHPDLHIYIPEGKSAMHSIASMREMISQVFLAPFEAKAKVFIIEDADCMLPTSANALLKTLEEPEIDSYIILLTANETMLLPTITSRCMKLQFYAIAENILTDFIIKKWHKKPSEALYIAHLSHGSIGQAEEIITHVDHNEKKEILLSILSKGPNLSYIDLSMSLEKLEKLFSKDIEEDFPMKRKKQIDMLLMQITMWYRDLHLLKENVDHRYLFYQDHLSLLQQQDLSQLMPLEQMQKALVKVQQGIERNIKLSTCLEIFFLGQFA